MSAFCLSLFLFFFQAEDGIRDDLVTGVQTCALPIFPLTAAGFLANERFNKAIYGDHPASVRGTTAGALDKITPATLKEFRDSHYVAGNAILAISGDIDPKVIMPKLEKTFGSWAKGTPPKMKWPEPRKPV